MNKIIKHFILFYFLKVLYFFKDFIYLFDREREGGHRQGEQQREREKQALC